MTERPSPKKSESLEVRLSYPTKQAFMARCQAEGRSASEAVRGFIEAQLAPPAPPAPSARPKPRLRYWTMGGLVAAALAAIAVPSLARPAANAQFDAIDLNRDRAISGGEFARLDSNRDGRVSLAEFTAARGKTGRP